MATTRIMPLHVGKGRTESRAISDIMRSSFWQSGSTLPLPDECVVQMM